MVVGASRCSSMVNHRSSAPAVECDHHTCFRVVLLQFRLQCQLDARQCCALATVGVLLLREQVNQQSTSTTEPCQREPFLSCAKEALESFNQTLSRHHAHTVHDMCSTHFKQRSKGTICGPVSRMLRQRKIRSSNVTVTVPN